MKHLNYIFTVSSKFFYSRKFKFEELWNLKNSTHHCIFDKMQNIKGASSYNVFFAFVIQKSKLVLNVPFKRKWNYWHLSPLDIEIQKQILFAYWEFANLRFVKFVFWLHHLQDCQTWNEDSKHVSCQANIFLRIINKIVCTTII